MSPCLLSAELNTLGLLKFIHLFSTYCIYYMFFSNVEVMGYLLVPPGAMSLKIQVVFLVFFFSVENVHFNWIIGFSGTRDVFFLSQANSAARCR